MTGSGERTFCLRFFPYFKWSVYGLLTVNITLFFAHQTFIEGLESLAWVMLLALFEWETSQMDQPYVHALEQYAIHAARVLAYALILYSAYGYWQPEYIAEHGYWDLLNVSTWIAVVFSLEYDVYVPGYYGRIEWMIRNGVKILLYVALFGYAVRWVLAGEWLDGYDALLWIVCFFFVELNILRYEDTQPYADEITE